MSRLGEVEIDLDAEALDALTGRLGVAVSGGGDSIALMHLLTRAGYRPDVVTVNHGLRPEARQEAEMVGHAASRLGLSHHTLPIETPLDGNLQDAARQARRALIRRWAKARGIGTVALGHTADDQAETFLMRLSRGSGVEGLSAMEPATKEDGFLWIRPILHIRRERLRDWLKQERIHWVEDPSNEDLRFDRVKMRQALGTLDKAGISVPKIARTTRRLSSAKAVLFVATKDLSQAISTMHPDGSLDIEIDRLVTAQQAVRLRLLSEAIRFIGASHYTPRAHAIEELFAALNQGFSGRTLAGCLLRQNGATLSIRREPGAVGASKPVGSLWDERWMVTGDGPETAEVSALGEDGLAELTDWRETGIAREILLASPAVRDGDRLLAAPIAGHKAGYDAKFTPVNPFFTSRPITSLKAPG